MKKYWFLIILLFVTIIQTSAQQKPKVSDSQLAFQYYMDKDFAKAAEMYRKVYSKSKSKVYFEYYIRCLNSLKDFETAEKAIKKQIRKYPRDLSYLVELGSVYKLKGMQEKSKELFNSAIKKMDKNKSSVISLANSFSKHQEYEYSEQVYIAGRKALFPRYTFRFELASVYTQQRNYEKMIYEYLELLNEDPSQLKNIQNRMQYYVTSETTGDLRKILRMSLLKRIQTLSSGIVYNEMLIWLYIQEKNFGQALIQSKALDRRLNEKGKRIFNLAELASSNQYFDVAESSYEYLIKKGTGNEYYVKARFGLLRLLYDKVIAGLVISPQEINDIEKRFLKVIEEHGKAHALLLMKDLAHLQAFYLNKPDIAIEMLQEAIALPRTTPRYRDECKIELADIMVLTGDIWEAPLIYKQVEQANEHNPIGHKAKFKKAKVAYYLGNFAWAQSQLDVLKASTSKLIANDAFELSQMISDNIGQDSTEKAMKMYANAELLTLQHKDSLALLTLDSVLKDHSSHTLVDEVYFRKGTIFEKAGKYEKAIEFYNKVVTDFGWDILADNALFKIASIYELRLENKEKAMELYKQILVDYKGSIYVIEARKRFRKLRGDSFQ